jgi:NAD(P)-dependent dehydrogenase (short-subunit alcohol dehydrogenase family)
MGHVLITGGNRGIGLELIKGFLKQNHAVTALVREPSAAAELQVLDSKALHVLKANVDDLASIKAAAAQVTSPVDILINNAAILTSESQGLSYLDLSTVEKSFRINVLGSMAVVQCFEKQLQAVTHPRVINITSLMGSIADNQSGGYYAYRISKTAVNMFTKNLSREKRDWIVACLHPGWVKTDMGGPQAPLQPAESATSLIHVILNLTPKDSGKFFDYRHHELPW